MKCPRCVQANPPQAKFCLECGTRIAATIPRDSDEQREVDDLRSALAEAAEQQAAAAEILTVIASSRNDVQPVFDAIARSAAVLCSADGAAVVTVVGEELHVAAVYSFEPDQIEALRRAYPQPIAQVAKQMNDRAIAAVPMLREGRTVGVITVNRRTPRELTDKQIAVLRTFADQAVIAIENVRLFKELEARNRDLTESLEQQTATADILRVIASSPTDLDPVLEAIARNAARLCEAADVAILRAEHDGHTLVFSLGPDAALRGYRYTDRRTVTARAIREGRTIHVPDLAAEPDYDARERATGFGWRTALAVPLIREGRVLGTVTARRTEVRPFLEAQIGLLQTFADQAVIAMENVRLFTELQEKNRALTAAHAQVSEALEQQTATGEILRVISSSPTGVQPVLDAVAENAARVCGANDAIIIRREGDRIRRVSHYGDMALVLPEVRPLDPATIAGRAMLEGRTIHAADTTQPDVLEEFPEAHAPGIWRTQLTVPLMREGAAIGAITIRRRDPRPFSDKQIVLLQTFADQAVIAIENARLFTELEQRNAALSEALDRQTATSEILRVISQSQTEVQPVFDAIVDNAIRLFRAWAVAVMQSDGVLLHLIAARGGMPGTEEYLRRQSPWSLNVPLPASRAVAERTLIHIPDAESEPTLDEGHRDLARTRGWRSVLAAPMLREGHPIGAITVTRAEAGPFSAAEVELLQTFADQAVIAVENTRLLGELRSRTDELTRSVSELRALSEVGQAISSTLDLATVLSTIVSRAVELSRLDGGVVFEYEQAAEEFVHRVATESGGALAEARRATHVRKGEGVVGQTALTLEPAQVPDIALPGAYESRLRDNLIESGVRAILAVPMLREGELIGCLVVSRNRPGEFSAKTIDLLQTFATQSALAIQNARLFREIEIKSRQLEVASQHKSEFLANMSHELRTPLNAVIGFSEVLNERMFGDLNEKQADYLKDIHASGQHLLSLINDILDLSKIEAGKMELEVSDFDLPSTIDNALTLVRERAGRRGIELQRSVDERLSHVQADERKLRQVLLNLLSNAIKFTPEGGRIEVRAVPVDGSVEVSVTDTGVGIAPEDQEAIFEEFKQVGTASKKVEGTGLGLALSRKFIELHGGRIWVKSQRGQGSTFTLTIPVRHGE